LVISFRLFWQSPIGELWLRTREAEFQFRSGLLVYLRRGCRHYDLTVHAGVCAIVGRRKRSYPGKLFQNQNGVWVGTVLAILVVFFIVVSTSATLHQHGLHIESAADAARALRPLAGPYAQTLFAIGLFGASMLAAGVLPLATAYSISEALGFEKGVSRSFREAPIFIGVFTFLVAVGAAIAVIPNLPLIRVLLVTQVINGLLLPIILFAILRLVNNRELMGAHVNSPLYNVGAWATAIIVTALSLLYILVTLFPNLLRF